MIGKVLRANTRSFVFGAKLPRYDVPIFGSLVKTRIQYRNATVFGLIFDIAIEDDGMTKLLSVADDVRPEDIEWQRNRRVPLEASVLCVGYQEEGKPIRQSLPAQPPIILDEVYGCDEDELTEFSAQFQFFRLIMESKDAPVDELLAASIRFAADARPSITQREAYIIAAGRELTRLLATDGSRLEGLLQRICI
jgi:hypothetical protein